MLGIVFGVGCRETRVDNLTATYTLPVVEEETAAQSDEAAPEAPETATTPAPLEAIKLSKPKLNNRKIKLSEQQRQRRNISSATAKLSVRDSSDTVADIDHTFTTNKRSDPNAMANLQNLGSGRKGSHPNGVSIGAVGGSKRGHAGGTATRLSLMSSARKGHRQEFNTEAYDRIYENDFLQVRNKPLSTFSIDVDTASYSNMRRFFDQGQVPPKGSVRIEEMINYFSYNYAQPEKGQPFSVNVEMATCPWNTDHLLARVGLKGRTMPQDERPASNLVFLLDVSGSMNSANKLPLLKKAFKLLVNQLNEKDRVAIAVYAGASGLVLPSTPASQKQTILDSLDRLSAGGSTNGGAGIELAYKVAKENFIKGGVNRVILATDGDFNIGVTNQGGLTRLIEEKAKGGTFLTVLGFGMGNYKDSTLEKLADKGNGNYGYIDTFKEARKVFADQINSTLVTIAKDVKIQVEFNPALVKAYRLVGYENRMLKSEDFNNDKKDAGEIGAGHTVTALYQIVPVGKEIGGDGTSVDALKYQAPTNLSDLANTGELMTVKLRYKKPAENKSKLIQVPVAMADKSFGSASDDFRFAASVASFGMLLRDSAHKGNATFAQVIENANNAKGKDSYGYRTELIDMVRTAKSLQ
jgi:Ca-activated chloride channel family protein